MAEGRTTGRPVFGNRFEPYEQLAGSTPWRFRALDRETRASVVLEVLPEGVGQSSAEFRRQLQRSMRAARSVDHANVAPPMAVGWEQGRYWFATSAPDGRTLGDIVRADEPLDEPAVVGVALEVTDALVAAHRVKLAHGDLDVDEVIEAADDGRLVLAGFGRAHVVGAHGDPGTEPSTWGDLRDLGRLVRTCLGDAAPSPELATILERLDAAGHDDGYSEAREVRADIERLATAGASEPGPEPGLVRTLPAVLKVLVGVLALGALAGAAIFVADRLGFEFGDPAETTVPDLVGATQELAIERLDAAGLGHAVQSQESTDVEEGAVIEQIPAAGESLDEGDTVTVVVSTGGVPVRVPEVIGLREAEAVAALEGANLVVQVEQDTRVGFTSGQVVNQTPGGGNEADEGDTVTITVAP